MDEAPVAPSDDSGNADAPAAGASHPGRPAGPHFLAAQTRLRAALRGSAAPYTQGVGEWIDTFQGPDAGTHLEALAAMAVGTRDPRLYALAFRACRHLDVRDGSTSPPPPSCDRLDARQWARLDAGNAVPWADLLAEAQARGDLSGQQEALFHIAEAQRWADRFYDPAGIIGAQLQEEPDTLAARTTLLVEALGYSGAAMVTTTPISRACSPTAVGDANRRQLCTRIAALMYDRSDNLVAAVLGSRYHQYATGDASWRTALEKERGRYADRPYERPVGDKTPLPCTPLQTLMDDIRDMARLGERQAHQAWRKAGARP